MFELNDELETRNPKLVVLAADMPELNGFQVCEQLRRIPPRYKACAVMLLTTHDGLDCRARGVLVGASDYATKPITPAELTLKVTHLLVRSAAPAGAGDTNLATLRSNANAMRKRVAALEKKAAARPELEAQEKALEPISRDLWEIQRAWAAEAQTAQVAQSANLATAVRGLFAEISKKLGGVHQLRGDLPCHWAGIVGRAAPLQERQPRSPPGRPGDCLPGQRPCVKSFESDLEAVLNAEVFRGVSDPEVLPLGSPVLQRKEGYREILHVPLGFYEAEKVRTPPVEGTLKIAYLGNIVPFKGALVLLRETMRLRKMDSVELHIHGRPVNELYFDEVKQFVQHFPSGKAFLHGAYRSDKEMRDILSKVHLVVFPSLWEENYPPVVRETLLHGVPVIGSKLGGVPEALQDGVNGFLFDPYREGDLAEKIGPILDNPSILDRITVNAASFALRSGLIKNS